MKYISFQLLLRLVIAPLALLVLKIQAQSWPMPNAIWQYTAIDEAGTPQGYVEYQYTGDTLIGGKIYQQISRVYEDVNYPPFPFNHVVRSIDPGTEDWVKHSIYTRFSNDTVYRCVSGKEYVFFTFSSNVGDAWSGFRSNPLSPKDSVCNVKLPLNVKEKTSIFYSGIELKRMLVEDTLYEDIYSGSVPPAANPVYEIIERLGVLNNFPFASELYTSNCQTQSDYGYHLQLKNYKDDEISYYTDIQKNEESQLTILPNPAQEEIKINFKNSSSSHYYKISDPSGRIVDTGSVIEKNARINILALSNGLYFISIIHENEVIIQSFLVNH